MPEIIAGRFELMEHISAGGSGLVWLARDLQRGELCAAKVMRQSYSGELLRFVREQGVKFEHEHLLTPYGWAAVDESVVIASRLCSGGNLHTAMADYGAFSPELTAEILTQLLDGLAHVHAAGWVHRDVKPANVLLEATGTAVPHVRLADFGIAAHRDDPRLTTLGMTVGTEGYLAPELASGADPHPAADLYALGQVGLKLMGVERAAQLDGPLGQVLAALVDQNPQVRLQMADRAPELLAPLRSAEGYTAASGEVFEVFDQFEEFLQGDSSRSVEAREEDQTAPAPRQEPARPVRSAGPSAAKPRRTATPRRKTAAVGPWLVLAAAAVLGALSLWLVFG